jgi:hypothetical protein
VYPEYNRILENFSKSRIFSSKLSNKNDDLPEDEPSAAYDSMMHLKPKGIGLGFNSSLPSSFDVGGPKTTLPQNKEINSANNLF